MKIALISPFPDLTNFGLRNISAYLRANGIATRMIFLPDPLGDDLVSDAPRYPESILARTAELCADADLVGISLMTNYFDNARQITAALKAGNVKAPVIWGGVHPTLRPAECIRIADMVCVGDGEEAMLELAQHLQEGQDITHIRNIWVRKGDQVIENPVRPLTQDLDGFPPPDYSLEDHFAMTGGRIRPMTTELFEKVLASGTVSRELGRIGYQTMTGRGCPHKCTYCINDAIRKIYGAKGYLRWRSTAHVIDELVAIRKRFPFVGFIWISDDAFFGRRIEAIKEFCEAYKKHVNLPFTCLASPLTMSEEKMAVLIDAGLFYMQMGIQSGSPRVRAIYNRQAMTDEIMLKAMHIINSYQHKMHPPAYDFILDMPYETLQDNIDTIRFIARIPKPFRLQPFSLVLYPGTQLHDMAAQDGLLANESRDVYSKSYTMQAPTYFNFLVLAAKNGRIPASLLMVLTYRPLARLLGGEALKPFWAFTVMKLKRLKGFLRHLRNRP